MPDLKVRVGVDKSEFTTGLASMENSVKSFGKKVGGLLIGAFAFDTVLSSFEQSIEKLDKVAKLSKAFDVSAESLQKLGGVAELSGASMDDVARALKFMSQSAFAAGQKGGVLAPIFASIGVSLEDLKKNSPEDLFIKIADGLSKIENPVTRTALGVQFFGRGFMALAPMMADGGAAIQKLAATMSIASDEAVMSAEKIDDTFKQLSLTLQSLMGTFAVATSPLIQFFATGAEQMLTFAASISQVASGEKKFKNLFSNISKDQQDLKNKQTDRVLRGASDNELQKELDNPKLKKEFRAKIILEVDQRKAFKENKNKEPLEASSELQKKLEKEQKEFDQSEKAAAQHDLKLIEATISSKELAEKMKQDIEERYAQRSLDRARELAQQRADLMPDLEDLRAERAGPAAERELLQRRATEAGEQARKSKNVEDVARAERAALAFQRAKESQLRARGFGDESTSMARSAANQAVGPLPSSAELQQSLDDSKESIIALTDKQAENTKQLEKLNIVLDKMPQENNRNLRKFPTAFENQMADEQASLVPGNFTAGLGELFDFKKLLNSIPDSVSPPKNQPVELENPPDLKGIMDKLDKLIANAGVFS